MGHERDALVVSALRVVVVFVEYGSNDRVFPLLLLKQIQRMVKTIFISYSGRLSVAKNNPRVESQGSEKLSRVSDV